MNFVAANDTKGILLWSLVLLAVVIVGFILVLWVKRRMQVQDTDTGPKIGFSLADLRELHRTGKISDQEFERARGKMAASLKHRESTEKPKKAD